MERTKVTDATPRCVVRYDDSRADQLDDVPVFTDAGVPVTMAIYAQSVVNNTPESPIASRLTANQLTQMIKRAESRGAAIECIHHTNTGFQKYGVGNHGQYTDADMIEELSPDPFDALGLPHPKFFLCPGDPGLNEWISNHRTRIEEILRDHGFEGAIGIWHAGASPLSSTYAPDYSTYMPNTPAQLFNPEGNAFYGALQGVRPGVISNPFHHGDQFTVDLGSKLIGVPVGHPSGATPFVLGRDNSGNGQEGDKYADAAILVQHQILRYLGAGVSFQIALHSRASSLALTGGTAPTPQLSVHPNDGGIPTYYELPHSMSLEHLAWILKKLDETGHIKLCNMSEWMEHVNGEYEVGTDLVNHGDNMKLAQEDMQDWSCGEQVFFDGTFNSNGVLTTEGWNRIYVSNVKDLTDPSAPASPDDPIKLDTPPSADFIGPQIVGPKGRPGAIKTKPGGVANTSQVDYQFNSLAPGRYVLSLSLDYLDVDSQLTLLAAGLVGMRNVTRNPYYPLTQNVDVPGEDQDFEFAFPEDQTAPSQGYLQTNAFTGNIRGASPNNELRFPFIVPNDPRPWRGVRHDETPAGLAAGASTSFVATAPGAMPGDRVLITTNKHQDFHFGRVHATGIVTAPNQVTVHLHNYDTAAYSGSSTQFGVYWQPAHGHGVMLKRTVAHTGWAWHLGISLKKDGTSEALFSMPSLHYMGRLQ